MSEIELKVRQYRLPPCGTDVDRDGDVMSSLRLRKRLLLGAAAMGLDIARRTFSLSAVTLDRSRGPARRAAPTPQPSPPPQAPAAACGNLDHARGSHVYSCTQRRPAYQVIATTPVTGIGFDRNKVPAMVQTLTAEDFSRVYSPNVLETLKQRIPGVITTDVQGNGFFQDLRYRGFAASPLQGTPQGLAVYMQRHPHQRSLRRHRQLGFDPDHRDRPRRRLDQQSGLRPQCARRRDQPPDEGRLQLQGLRIRRVGRLLRPHRRLACNTACAAANGRSISRPRASRMTAGATSRRRRSARFYGDLGWRGHGCRGPPRHVHRRQLLRRGRSDADPTAQQRLSSRSTPGRRRRRMKRS